MNLKIVLFINNNGGASMSFYKDKSDMFSQRAKRAKQAGDKEWAMAKNGEGDFHYGNAKNNYARAEEYKKKAEKYKGESW